MYMYVYVFVFKGINDVVFSQLFIALYYHLKCYITLNLLLYLYILLTFSNILVSEVEKQLQGSSTPQMSYKKPHSGSTGNINNMVLVADQVQSNLFDFPSEKFCLLHVSYRIFIRKVKGI